MTETRQEAPEESGANPAGLSRFASRMSLLNPEDFASSGWIEHAAFAFWLIETLTPRKYVELGTHSGYSYFAICQAVKKLDLPTTCYAIDTWSGDEHAGLYDESVYVSVAELNEKYRPFSTLVRSKFDEAVLYFPDNSIDLLHVDGRHFYEDVKSDFEVWIPKLTDHAIVLFHDTNVRERGFGVWRYFEELKKLHSTFEFFHGHGLGIVAINKIPQALEGLFACGEKASDDVRSLYAQLGANLNRIWVASQQKAEAIHIGKSLEALSKSYDVVCVSLDTLQQQHNDLLKAHGILTTEQFESKERFDALKRDRDEMVEKHAATQRVHDDNSARLFELQRNFNDITEKFGTLQLDYESALEKYEALRNHKSDLADQAADAYGALEVLAGMTIQELGSPPSLQTRPARFARLIRGAPAEQLTHVKSGIANRIYATGLFQGAYYLSKNPEVISSGMDPAEHFELQGWKNGRRPNPFFDPAYYTQQNPDVAESGMNPLLHYADDGWREGRRPSVEFDPAFYLKQYPDVAEAAINPLLHYVEAGLSEGRMPRKHGTRQLVSKVFPVSPIRIGSSASRPGHFFTRLPSQRLNLTALCVGHVMPHPPRAGNEYRVNRLLKWVTEHMLTYTLICPLAGELPTDEQMAEAAAQHNNFMALFPTGEIFHNLSDNDPVLKRLRKGISGIPHEVRIGLSAKTDGLARAFCPDYLVAVVAAIQKEISLSMMLVEYIFMTPLLSLCNERTLKVIDTIDVFSSKAAKVENFGVSDGLALSVEEESSLLRKADLLLAIQDDEADELRRLAPGVDVLTVGVDFEVVKTVLRASSGEEILCVASDNPMNVKGLSDFLRLCWPLVLSAAPEARLSVVGSVGKHLDFVPPGVAVVGSVSKEDLEGQYERARAVINPVAAGTGLKIKTVEAISHCRMVATWPAGVAGLSQKHKKYCQVATNWVDFAEGVALLFADDNLVDLPSRDSERIADLFSGQNVYVEFAAVIQRLTP